MFPVQHRHSTGPIELQGQPVSAAGNSTSNKAVTDLPSHGTAGGVRFQIGRACSPLSGRGTELLHALFAPANAGKLSLGAPDRAGQASATIPSEALVGLSPDHQLPSRLRLTCSFDKAMNLTHARVTDATEASSRVYCDARFEPEAEPAQHATGPLQPDRQPRSGLSSLLCCLTRAGSSPDAPTRIAPAGPASFIDRTGELKHPTPGLNLLLDHLKDVSPDYFSEQRHVVDLGAGGGRDTRSLLRHNCQVTAVDPDVKMPRKLAASRGPNLQTVTGTLMDASLMNASQDVVNVQRVLPFIHGAALDSTLQEIARVLKPGGILSASVFGPRHTWNNENHPMYAKLAFQSEDQIRGLLKKAGFELHTVNASNNQETAGNGEIVPHWDEIRFVAKKALLAADSSPA